MIRIPSPTDPLRPAERFGLSVLLDASRLLVVDDPAADVVRLTFTDDPANLAGLIAGRWPLTGGDGEVRLSRSGLRLVTELAGAGVEQSSFVRDGYGRVPASENPLVRLANERRPVISEFGRGLKQAAAGAAGPRPLRLLAPWPNGRRWAAAFTHDLDVVAGWPLFLALRLGELLRGGHLGQATRSLASAVASVGRDPVRQGCTEVLEAERALQAPATWFVLCGTPTFSSWRAGDLTYRLESPAARRLLAAFGEHRHEIGLHGSFATMDRDGSFRAQRARLQTLIGGAPSGVRQHFLRIRPGATQHAMVGAGFRYDATFGFSDRNGFRLGLADVVPGWDESGQRAIPIEEVPLVWMDRAQSKYQGIQDPDAWVSEAAELAQTCRDVEGLWVGLWHPNLISPLGFPGGSDAYRRLIESIVARQPYLATLQEIVEWRSARRSVRAVSVGPSGPTRLTASNRVSWPLVLEDATGRVMETRTWPEAD